MSTPQLIPVNTSETFGFGDPDIIRADIVIETQDVIRVWGKVTDTDGKPLANILVLLLQITTLDDRVTEDCISFTKTICGGYYQFELSHHKATHSIFKILATTSYPPFSQNNNC